MKLGHFGALCCAVIALLSAGVLYWDLQDGYFSTMLLALPIITGTLTVALLLLPGGPVTFQEAARDPGTERAGRWLASIPPLHRRAWLVAVGLSYYLTLGTSEYLQGKDFFSLGEQLLVLVVGGILWLVLRKQLRRMW